MRLCRCLGWVVARTFYVSETNLCSMRSVISKQCRDRKINDVTGFGSFNNSMCERVLDLL